MSSPSPHLIRVQGSPNAREPPPGVVKAIPLVMHPPLLSIHFYLLFLAPQTFLFHPTLFTPSIYPVHGLPLNLTLLISNPTIRFTNWSSSILSMSPNHFQHRLFCSTSQLSHNTSSPSHPLISHSDHMSILLRHPISDTFNLFSGTADDDNCNDSNNNNNNNNVILYCNSNNNNNNNNNNLSFYIPSCYPT